MKQRNIPLTENRLVSEPFSVEVICVSLLLSLYIDDKEKFRFLLQKLGCGLSHLLRFYLLQAVTPAAASIITYRPRYQEFLGMFPQFDSLAIITAEMYGYYD